MPLLPLLLLAAAAVPLSSAVCSSDCPLALGSYYISDQSDIGINLTYISSLFNTNYSQVLLYNQGTITNKDYIVIGSRVNVFFPCECFSGKYLAANFPYRTIQGDTYAKIASNYYANLTSADALTASNTYPANNIPTGVYVNVTINCSCGDPSVSTDYGLFETYPLRPGENLSSVAADFNLSNVQSLLQKYNPGVNFSKGQGIVFIPAKDPNGSYRPLKQHKAGNSGGVVAGIVVALVVLLGLGICIYFGIYKRKKTKSASLPLSTPEGQSTSYHHGQSTSYDHDVVPGSEKTSIALIGMTTYTVDRSVKFSYEELAKATDDFSMANKIGEGGFGAVYYAELRGEFVTGDSSSLL